METCPHCGVRLPHVVDAFCPDCFAALDEMPARSAAARKSEAPAEGSALGGLTGLLPMLSGFGVVFVGVAAAMRGQWGEAVYMGSVGMVLILAGVWYLGREQRS